MSGNGYPFVTRRQILVRLDRDPAFVCECITILHRRFVDRDLLTPPAGWMSSQRKAGEELFARLSGDAATAADIAAAAKLAKRYANQLCKVFRDEQLARDPHLATAAAVFGVRAPVDDDRDLGDDPYADLDAERGEAAILGTPANADEASESRNILSPPEGTVEHSAPTPAVDPGPTKRRPGRPKGSKNRPREDRVKPRGKRGRRS